MENYLEILRKEKKYVELLNLKLNKLKNKKCLIKNKQEKFSKERANLYIKLNKNQYTEEENSYIGYIMFFSLLLFLLSFLGIYVTLGFGYSLIKRLLFIVGFNIGQIFISLLVALGVKKYYFYKRRINEEIINDCLYRIKELNIISVNLERKHSDLKMQIRFVLSLIAKHEEKIKILEQIILENLLKLEQENALGNDFINKEIEYDIDMKRVLSHFENK